MSGACPGGGGAPEMPLATGRILTGVLAAQQALHGPALLDRGTAPFLASDLVASSARTALGAVQVSHPALANLRMRQGALRRNRPGWLSPRILAFSGSHAALPGSSLHYKPFGAQAPLLLLRRRVLCRGAAPKDSGCPASRFDFHPPPARGLRDSEAAAPLQTPLFPLEPPPQPFLPHDSARWHLCSRTG